MKKQVKAGVIAVMLTSGVLLTYGLVGKWSYFGPRTEVAIIDGPDINVPYEDKYGMIGYAYSRDYYRSGQILERRIESLSPLKLALSSVCVSILWFAIALAVTKCMRLRRDDRPAAHTRSTG